MDSQRVWSGRVVAIFACVVFVAASGEIEAQSNLFVAEISLKAEKPDNVRPWSADLNQILLLPQIRDGDASSLLSSNPRAGWAADMATNHSGAMFQEPWGSIDEERMDVLMRRIEEGGYGISTYERDRSAFSRAFERGVKTVFMPEPIKLGHARLGFSPYTAIKRKNPFCLLNPVPLALSW